jgi:hypothetical protein
LEGRTTIAVNPPKSLFEIAVLIPPLDTRHVAATPSTVIPQYTTDPIPFPCHRLLAIAQSGQPYRVNFRRTKEN